MTKATWKNESPEAPGLYIASIERSADFVRYWTGEHWSAPLNIRDLCLTDRIPGPHSKPAKTHQARPIEWLEPFSVVSQQPLHSTEETGHG